MVKSTHVVPNPDKGGWDIKQSGADCSSGHFDTKKEVEDKAHQISRNQETKKLS